MHNSRHTKYPSQIIIPQITLFAICLSFSSPPLHPCRFIRPLFSARPSFAMSESCEINAALLNLVMKDQFVVTPNEDVASHLNTFVELCDMGKKKYVDNDCEAEIISVFFARSAKFWFSSLPRNSIDTWNKCKDAFITKYFLPAIFSLRTQIMNFKQLEHEHVAQSWERMKLMLRNFPTHGLILWMIYTNFLCGIEFCFS